MQLNDNEAFLSFLDYITADEAIHIRATREVTEIANHLRASESFRLLFHGVVPLGLFAHDRLTRTATGDCFYNVDIALALDLFESSKATINDLFEVVTAPYGSQAIARLNLTNRPTTLVILRRPLCIRVCFLDTTGKQTHFTRLLYEDGFHSANPAGLVQWIHSTDAKTQGVFIAILQIFEWWTHSSTIAEVLPIDLLAPLIGPSLEIRPDKFLWEHLAESTELLLAAFSKSFPITYQDPTAATQRLWHFRCEELDRVREFLTNAVDLMEQLGPDTSECWSAVLGKPFLGSTFSYDIWS